jgi:hypothetical protein
MTTALPGITGSLFPSQFLADGLGDDLHPDAASGCAESRRRQLTSWWERVEAACGPATGLRAIFDVAAMPLFGVLGFRARNVVFTARGDARAWLETPRDEAVGLIVRPWGAGVALWRDAYAHAADVGASWCFIFAPPLLSLLDARGHATRRAQTFRFPDALDVRSCACLLLLCQPRAFEDDSAATLAHLTHRAARHHDRVRRDLQEGVIVALGSLVRVLHTRAPHPETTALSPFDEALTLVYRVLFLLFAESRDLVPHAHPTYAAAYAIGGFCRESAREATVPGLWEGLAAITRLSRVGVRAGDLIVRPFNGRLFAKAAAPSLEPARVAARPSPAAARRDAALQRALHALGTRPGPAGRVAIAYADLGVEQLGAVYERVLDVDPDDVDGGPKTRAVNPWSRRAHSVRRKESGTFYTPQSLTAFVVRRTLAPLVEGATTDAILSLRVVDPAMGSGAFLVAACAFLAEAYERALIEEGRHSAADIDDQERADIRRLIAERCLAGVDINPVAVQLARLSMWLTTLARGKPLTFLDHRLRVGNSLIGITPEDIGRVPSGRRGSPAVLPLFDGDELGDHLRRVSTSLREMLRRRDDTVDDVRAKEETWAQLSGVRSPLVRWRLACDAWCARWFTASRPSPAELRATLDAILKGDRTLQAGWLARRLDDATSAAAKHLFFHWPLEFPELFYDDSGQVSPLAGFDAVIGNPPWEMLRHDSRGSAEDAAGRDDLIRFVRESGLYPNCHRGHLNLYQPFLERAFDLVRPGGRVGLVLPWSLATDDGAAAMRARILDRSALDTIVGVENSGGLFPVHRGLRFMVMVASPSAPAGAARAKFGLRSSDELDALPGRDDPLDTAYPIRLDPRDLARWTGAARRIPYARHPAELALLARLTSAHPPLGSDHGWVARFGRELNATEDRQHFGREGLPVIEGKHIAPFVVDTTSEVRIDRARARRLLPRRPFEAPRLGYRDVSAASNRLSLIAAIVPAGIVTTHTIFCLRAPGLSIDRQHFLCGVFNSFVLNCLVRLLVGSHVTTSLVESLPVPVWTGTPLQRRIARLSRVISARPGFAEAHAALQAAVALAYDVDDDEFRALLDGFPLVAADERARSHTMLAAIRARGRRAGRADAELAL